MNTYTTQDAYLRALRFASIAHTRAGQRYPGTEVSYVMHLAFVAGEVLAALPHEPELDGALAVQLAALHDVIEDTDVTFDEVASRFGDVVACGVAALTKDETLPKPQAMADSLTRILNESKEVHLVKLADRVANMEKPPHYWGSDKRRRYQEEARVILEKLGPSSSYLAERLRQRIEAYGAYVDA